MAKYISTELNIIFFTLILILLGFYPLFSQDIKISIENRDSTGINEVLFKVYDNLGIGEAKLIRNSAGFKSDSDSVMCFYISNSMSGGILYLKRGDSVSVTKEANGLLKYNGSKEIEHNLVEILYANDIQGYGPVKGDIQALSMQRLMPYMKGKLSQLNEIVERYVKENPNIDLEILEIIKNDAKYNYLKEAIRKIIYKDYSPENSRNLNNLLKEDGLEALQNIQFRNSFLTNVYQKEYLDFLFYDFYKEKILTSDESGYFEQLLKRLKFYLKFEDPLRDEVYFGVLLDFFKLKTWANTVINEYTKDYFIHSGNVDRKDFIKGLENKALLLQNTEFQAKMILSDTLVRKQVLLKPDNSKITFGQLLDSMQYKWVYIDAWATWCAPCRQEMNKLNIDIIKKTGVKMVFFSIDDEIEKWKSVSEKMYHFDGLVEHYRIDKNSILAQRFFDDSISIPAYFLFNVSRNRFYHNVEKPTKFNLDVVLK